MGQLSSRGPALSAGLHGLAAFLLLSISGLAVRAEPAEDPADEPTTPEAPEAPVAPAAAPAKVPTNPDAPVAQPTVAFIEHMGPETFPGRLRGLYGRVAVARTRLPGAPVAAEHPHWPGDSSANIWIDNGLEAIKRDPDQSPNSRSFPAGARRLARHARLRARQPLRSGSDRAGRQPVPGGDQRLLERRHLYDGRLLRFGQ